MTREDIQACSLFAKSLDSTLLMPLAVEMAKMRFIVDECTGPAVALWLRAQRLLAGYADQLADRYVVVTETRVRFAKR